VALGTIALYAVEFSTVTRVTKFRSRRSAGKRLSFPLSPQWLFPNFMDPLDATYMKFFGPPKHNLRQDNIKSDKTLR